MPDLKTHPSHQQLSAYNRGQLPPDEVVEIESHVSECQTCCETIVGLSAEDTFVDLLKEAHRFPVEQAEDGSDLTIDQTAAEAGPPAPTVPAALAEHSRYEIVDRIGKGGMGDVYKAKHRMMDRTVAL